MNKIINFKILTIMLLINTSMLCTITPPNPEINEEDESTPIVTEGKIPPPRDIIVILDHGQEGPFKELFVNNPLNPQHTSNAITGDFAQALTSNTKSPIYVSESIMKNLVARQTIAQDFLTLSVEDLKNKYGSTQQFSSEEYITAFQNICKTLDTQITNLKKSFNTFAQSPNEDLIKDVIKKNNQLLTSYQNFIDSTAQQLFNGDKDKATIFLENIESSYLPYKNNFDVSQWAIGKTNDGGYLLLPKNADGTIASTGLQYNHLDGLNGTTITNPFDNFNSNIKTGSTVTHTDVNAQGISLLDIIRIVSANSSQNSSIITFNPEDHAKLNIFITGHGMPETDNSDGIIAGIDITIFKTKILPVLITNCYIQTFTLESCYGAVDNLLKAFGTEPLPFTLISGLSTYTTLSFANLTILNQIATVLNQERSLYLADKPFSTTEELNKKINKFNKFNDYYNLIKTNVGQGIANIFSNRNQTTITGATGSPSIQIAGTTDLQTLDYVRKNLKQISNTKNITTQLDEAFYYNLPKGGGIMLASETIIAPIVIETGSELPFIVPLSVGEKIHYIQKMIIQDPSITVEQFIAQSIKPFIDQMNQVTTSIGNKIIIIDSLHTKNGTVTLVVNKNYAFYTIKEESLTFFRKKILHIVALSDKPFSWAPITNFDKLLKQGRNQATEEMLNRETLQGVLTVIHDRQKTLRLIQKLTEKIAWEKEQYGHTHEIDVGDDRAIFRAVMDVVNKENKRLSKEILSKDQIKTAILSTISNALLSLSPDELEVLANVIHKTIDTIADQEMHNILDTVFITAHEEMIRKELIATVNQKKATSDEELIDWYIGLSLDAQIIIKYEFNAAIENGTILSQDPNTLTTSERIALQEFLKATKSVASSSTQIADFDAKIQKLTMPRDETIFNKYINDHYNTLINSSNKTAFIDWIAALNKTERQSINLDIIAFVAKEAFNDPSFQSCKLNTLNITELFTLKDILGQFFKSSSADQNSILEKASILYKNKITMNDFTTRATPSLQTLEDAMINLFNKLNNEQAILLIIPNSKNIYAEIFKTLSFTSQKKIIEDGLSILKESSDDVLKYQQSLIDERIKTAQTVEDFSKLKADIDAAKIPLTGTQKTLLAKDFFSAESAENKAIAQDIPFPNHGSTGTIVLNQEIIDEITDQPIIIDDANKKQPDPLSPIDTPGKIIPDTNPFKDEKTKKEYDKEAAAEKKRQDEVRTTTAANEEAQQEALKQEQSGNHEPVVFDIQ